MAEHAHLLGSSGIPIIRELFAADAAAAATGGAAADSIAAAAGSELPSPHKLDSKVGGCMAALGSCAPDIYIIVRYDITLDIFYGSSSA